MMRAALFCNFCMAFISAWVQEPHTERQQSMCGCRLGLTCKVSIKHFQVEHSLIYAKDLIWGLVLLKGDQCGFRRRGDCQGQHQVI